MARILIFVFFTLNLVAQPSVQGARELVNKGKIAEAESALKKIVSEKPVADAFELLGDICGQRKDWDCAVERYSSVRELEPNVADAHYKYGGALGMKAKSMNKFRALSMIAEIRESFEKAIALDPKHLEARWALIELNLQLPAIAGGSIKTARRYASELARLSPVDGILAEARIAEYQENFASAEKNYKLAWEKHKSKTAARKLAALYKKMNKPQKAGAVLSALGEK